MGILDRGAHDIYFQIEEHHFLKKILFSDSIRQYLIKTKIIFIMVIRLKKTKQKAYGPHRLPGKQFQLMNTFL